MRRPRWLLALSGAVLGLALAEGAARITGEWLCADVAGVVNEADPVLGWRQRPHLRGWAAFCRGRALPPALIVTDERGFLNPGRPIERPPDTARILLLGGNVPQALGVPWPLSMAGMLEGRADARRGRRLEVVNGAMGSFGLDQDLLLLRAEGARVAPDLVLAVIDPVVELTAVTPELIALASARAPVKPYFDVQDGTLVPREIPTPEPAPPPVDGPQGALAASALYRWLRGVVPDPGMPQAWLPVEPVPTDQAAELARGERVTRALLAALHDEASRLGARLALVLVPPPRAPRFGEETPTHRLLTMARELGIPATSLALAFRAMPALFGNPGYLPESTRFNADGHFLASHAIWTFLEREKLLPAGVVASRMPAGGRVAPLDPLPQALLAAIGLERTGGVVRVVAASLAAVILSWLAAPLPRRARDWIVVGASLLPIGLLGGTAAAAVTLALALAVYGIAEIRLVPVRRVLLGLALATVLVGPVLWLADLPTERSVPIRLYVGLAVGMSVLRLAGYATERRRRDVRAPLVDYLIGMLFFPTFAGGPIQSVWALARARRTDPLAPGSVAALGRLLGGAGYGAARLAWGTAKVVVTPLLLGLLTPDVIGSSGDAVGRLRLWAWLVETSVYLWIVYGGWSDIGIGLAAMVGVRAPENFRAPWAAVRPADFWRRTLVTVTGRLRRLVGAPVARRLGAPAGAVACVVAGALWQAPSVLALYGAFGSRPGAWAGLVGWALLHAAGIVAGDRLRLDARGPLGRLLGWTTTHLLVALAWVPFAAFPFGTAGTIIRIYARLLGFR
jgi:hypothetical protein